MIFLISTPIGEFKSLNSFTSRGAAPAIEAESPEAKTPVDASW